MLYCDHDPEGALQVTIVIGEDVLHTLEVVLEIMAQAIRMLLVHMRNDALLRRILGGSHLCDF